MITFVISILGSLVIGYLTVALVFIILMFSITRLGRKVLMHKDRVSTTYITLLWCTWLVASLAGAYVCVSLAPLPPYGPRLFPWGLAAFSGFLLFRETRQLPQEHSVFTTLGNGTMVLTGTLGALYLRHAL